MDEYRILVTNDDGIDAPGIAALYEELDPDHDVTVVAPARNRSGVGRTRNGEVVVRDHEFGYELAGTPADCVAYGLEGLDGGFDVVLSGINDGPNLGNYVVGRSGTVGAGIEAAFLGTPAIALSAYHTTDFFPYPAEDYEFDAPARIATDLLERIPLEAVFETVDLLNVNAPVDVFEPPHRLTHLTADYGQVVEHDPDDPESVGEPGDTPVRLVDKTWPHVEGFTNPFPLDDDQIERYHEDSDRRAVADGAVSVSPLSITHEYVESEPLSAAMKRIDEQRLG